MTATARDEILARIRAALGPAAAGSTPAGSTPAPPRDYRRAGQHAPGAPELLELLAGRLIDYRATVHRTSRAALPTVLASTLESAGRLVVPPGLPAGWAPPGAIIDDGTLTAAELDTIDTVLTACTAACAETGTIVLDGSADQGRRAVTLVPDRHVCVVFAGQVVQTVPELLERVDPNRPLTFVSGPSATSDIELQRVEGVHGPRDLVVILVEG